MAEALHHQVGREAQASQFLHLVTGHRTCGVLRANRGHERLAARSRLYAGESAGFAHHLLGQCESPAVVLRGTGTNEDL